jgi:hypothetical protein
MNAVMVAPATAGSVSLATQRTPDDIKVVVERAQP